MSGLLLWSGHIAECWSYVCYLLSTFTVEGEDYTVPLPIEVTFSSDASVGTSACATFGIINDGNLEFDHEFTVNLSSVTPTGPVLSAMSSLTTVTILDDEGTYVCMLFIAACVPFLVHFSALRATNDGGEKT